MRTARRRRARRCYVEVGRGRRPGPREPRRATEYAALALRRHARPQPTLPPPVRRRRRPDRPARPPGLAAPAGRVRRGGRPGHPGAWTTCSACWCTRPTAPPTALGRVLPAGPVAVGALRPGGLPRPAAAPPHRRAVGRLDPPPGAARTWCGGRRTGSPRRRCSPWSPPPGLTRRSAGRGRGGARAAGGRGRGDRQRPVPRRTSLAHLALATPALDEDDAALARQVVGGHRWPDRRSAARRVLDAPRYDGCAAGDPSRDRRARIPPHAAIDRSSRPTEPPGAPPAPAAPRSGADPTVPGSSRTTAMPGLQPCDEGARIGAVRRRWAWLTSRPRQGRACGWSADRPGGCTRRLWLIAVQRGVRAAGEARSAASHAAWWRGVGHVHVAVRPAGPSAWRRSPRSRAPRRQLEPDARTRSSSRTAPVPSARGRRGRAGQQ